MMDKTRKWLEYTDKILSGDDKAAACEIWDLMTATRGPDSEDFTLKCITTVPIRAKMFPLTAANPQLPAKFRTDGAPMPYQEVQLANGHFFQHVGYAYEILKLGGIW